jgi:predicted small integral membrane protein
MDIGWMAWTPVTAGFFIFIVLMLISMTVWQIVSPSIARRGLLPLVTTRGDRLFISLLGSAFIHLAWLGLTDLAVWIATMISVCFLVAVMRWG